MDDTFAPSGTNEVFSVEGFLTERFMNGEHKGLLAPR